MGYGNIGTQVGLMAEAPGMQVCFHDTASRLALGGARAMATLDAVLAAADVVTVHVPELPTTHGLNALGCLACIAGVFSVLGFNIEA